MGIIGSQIAIKTIGSPWYVDISAAALGFGIVYFSGYVIWRWRIFPLELKVFVFAALGFCVYNLLDVIDAVPEWPGAIFHATVIGLGVFVLWKFEKYYHLPRGQRKA